MTTSKFAAAVLGLTLFLALPAAANDTFGFVYLQRADDPLYEPHRAYTGLTLRDRHRPIDGARLAIRESRVAGRSIGVDFELSEETVAADADIRAVFDGIVERGSARVFLLDLPIDDVMALAAATRSDDLILFNIRHRDAVLRGEACSPVFFHTIPSQEMIADALVQYLYAMKWTDVLMLVGEHPEDRVLGDAFRASARKFGVRVVDERPFRLGNDPRQRDQNNIALMTGGVDYDVIFLADSVGEFGRYVPFQTYRPRPVVGSEGLGSGTWHWTWERYGAPQLNQRFERIASRRMEDEDWAAWVAVKSVVEAVARTRSTAVGDIRAFLTSEELTLDTYKGAPGNFRSWDHQLRQPILLYTHNAVIARAPLDGFMHRTNTLDTLGVDEPETMCRFR